MPCTLSILTNVFTADRDRARAIGIWSGTAGLGVAIGPMLGGFLLVHFWWGSVFLINVPIATIGLIATAFLVPNSKSPHPRRPDPLGAALSIVGIGLLLWGIIEAPNRTWTSPLVVGALAGSVVIIGFFVVWERSIDHPMLPLEFFGHRRYSAAIASLALLLFALLGLFFLFTQYLQFCLGFSPLKTGLAIGPIALVLLVAAPTSVIIARRLGTKPVVAGGLLLVAVGLGLLSRTTVHSTYRDAVPWLVLIGVGVGLGLAPSTESVMGSLPRAEAGVGSATSDTSMQLGGALGVAVIGTALNIRYQNFMTPLLAHQPIPRASTSSSSDPSVARLLSPRTSRAKLAWRWLEQHDEALYRAWISGSSSQPSSWQWPAWSSWARSPTGRGRSVSLGLGRGSGIEENRGAVDRQEVRLRIDHRQGVRPKTSASWMGVSESCISREPPGVTWSHVIGSDLTVLGGWRAARDLPPSATSQ